MSIKTLQIYNVLIDTVICSMIKCFVKINILTINKSSLVQASLVITVERQNHDVRNLESSEIQTDTSSDFSNKLDHFGNFINVKWSRLVQISTFFLDLKQN